VNPEVLKTKKINPMKTVFILVILTAIMFISSCARTTCPPYTKGAENTEISS
jgi:hypothetical protein